VASSGPGRQGRENAEIMTSGEGAAADRSWSFGEGDEIAPGYLAWDRLAHGPRFEMWIAWCRDRMTPVCVKLPRPDQLHRRAADALGRERDVVAALAHPAIPRLFAADLDAGIPYLVYEFIEGRPLSVVLDDDGPFDAHDVVFIGLQLAAALRHVHQRGFVHLDVKPANTSMRGERALLLDFDLTLPIGGLRSAVQPRGTYQYMSPEQIGCQPAHPAMDLFGLGALLFEAATADQLFALPSDESLSDSYAVPDSFPQLSRPVPDVARAAPGLTPEVASVIQRLLARDPADRPGDAGEVITLLEAALPPGSEPLWPGWVTPRILGTPNG
jgi:eukaryotic-like serine/threonine-protein kinase